MIAVCILKTYVYVDYPHIRQLLSGDNMRMHSISRRGQVTSCLDLGEVKLSHLGRLRSSGPTMRVPLVGIEAGQ